MRGLTAALTLALALQACTPDAPAPVTIRPYTVTAIDYHFHDAHPSLPIAADRTVRFTNQGQNAHAVTFVDLPYSRELPVDGELRIEPISSLVPGPGEYEFYCDYHRDREMTGVLMVR